MVQLKLEDGTDTHFRLEEFACRHCGEGIPATKLLYYLETRRREENIPIIITSGGRCTIHNTNIGGSIYSEHLIRIGKFYACDYIKRKLFDPLKEARWWEKEAISHLGGTGIYYRTYKGKKNIITPRCIHVDVGNIGRRSDYSKPRKWVDVIQMSVDGKSVVKHERLWLDDDYQEKTFAALTHFNFQSKLQDKGLM